MRYGFSFDAVAIPGWSGKVAIAALRWCAESGTLAILMSESAALDQPRMRWREWIKQRIVSLYSARLLAVSATLITSWRWECLATGSSPDTMWWTMSISARRRKRSEVRGQRSDKSMGCQRIIFSPRRDSSRKRISRRSSGLTRNIDGDQRSEVSSQRSATGMRRGSLCSWVTARLRLISVV